MSIVTLVTVLAMTLLGVGLLEPWQNRIQYAERELLASLKQITDVHALGDLLQAYQETRSPSGRIAMQKMVLELLERQTPEHHAVLTAAEQRLLGALLEYGSHLPLTRTNSGAYLALLDSAADVQLQRAVLRVLPFLSDQTTLPSLVRMIVRDAPSREGPAVREEARQVMSAQIATLDFGSVEKIPTWIERLPVLNAGGEGAVAPSDTGLDECIIAVCALTRLLPQLTAAHGVVLNSQARKRLRQAPRTIPFIISPGMGGSSINASRLGPDFTLAVLGTLELFGTSEDLPFVRYWANMDAPTPDLERIRHRARQVVPVLAARQKTEELSLSLLRGSTAPPAPANQLLRPATGHTGTEATNELLRPHQETPLQEIVIGVGNSTNSTSLEREHRSNSDIDTAPALPALNASSATEVPTLTLRQNQGGG